jgi:hypothetical protein
MWFNFGIEFEQHLDDENHNDDEIEKTLAILIGLIAGVALIIVFLSFLNKVCDKQRGMYAFNFVAHLFLCNCNLFLKIKIKINILFLNYVMQVVNKEYIMWIVITLNICPCFFLVIKLFVLFLLLSFPSFVSFKHNSLL